MSRQLSQQFSSYVKVSEFRYPATNEKPQLVYPVIPLSTVREKIFSMGQIDQEGQRSSTLLVREGDLLSKPTNQQSPRRLQVRSNSFRRFITPRDKIYKPQLLIFGRYDVHLLRYNYENYTNYAYKNPFRPKAPNIISSQQKPKRKQPFNYQTNIETVYYKTKYNDFNQLVQEKLKQSRSESILRKQASLSKRKKPRKSQFEIQARRTGRVKIGSSSLAHLIKEFNVLQKLTQLIQTEMFNTQQPLSVNLFTPMQQTPAQQIFLEVLIHRFGWLRRLNKRVAERIFSALGIESFERYTKISMKIYVEFVKLFVVRDATDQVLSEFLFKFFFSKKQIVTKEIFEDTLHNLQGPESKHKKILEIYSEFFEDPAKHYGFKNFSQKNANSMHMIMDLFVL